MQMPQPLHFSSSIRTIFLNPFVFMLTFSIHVVSWKLILHPPVDHIRFASLEININVQTKLYAVI